MSEPTNGDGQICPVTSTTAVVPSSSSGFTSPLPRGDSALSKRELANCRLYPNINTPEKAAVVLSKAHAWGLEPTCVAEAMYFVSGKPALSSNMHAVLVKRSGRYDYRVKEKTHTKCVLDFRERVDGKWEVIGTETFTMQDAQTAGITNNPSWKKFPAAMLFARCLTAGVRTHCPDVLAGTACYSVEELAPHAEYDAEGRPVVIDAEICNVSLPPASVDVAEVERLIVESGGKRETVLAYLNVNRVEEVTPDHVEKLKSFVNLKRRK